MSKVLRKCHKLECWFGNTKTNLKILTCFVLERLMGTFTPKASPVTSGHLVTVYTNGQRQLFTNCHLVSRMKESLKLYNQSPLLGCAVLITCPKASDVKRNWERHGSRSTDRANWSTSMHEQTHLKPHEWWRRDGNHCIHLFNLPQPCWILPWALSQRNPNTVVRLSQMKRMPVYLKVCNWSRFWGFLMYDKYSKCHLDASTHGGRTRLRIIRCALSTAQHRHK